jgi:hypothetical protein
VGSVDIGVGGSVVFAVNVNTTLPDGVTQIDNTALIDDDGTSGAPISGGSASTTINIVAPPEAPRIYLPLVARPVEEVTPVQQPDLIVSDVTLVPNKTNFAAGEEVEIVIEITNIGDALAEAVWVDLYLNPSQEPQASFRWNDICRPDSIANPCIGVAWTTREVLQPGESFTLVTDPTTSLGDGGYDAGKSRWFDFFESGTTDLYVLVDSWSGNAPAPDNGAVLESNEDNNLFHLPNLNVTGDNPALPQEELPEIESRPAPPE